MWARSRSPQPASGLPQVVQPSNHLIDLIIDRRPIQTSLATNKLIPISFSKVSFGNIKHGLLLPVGKQRPVLLSLINPRADRCNALMPVVPIEPRPEFSTLLHLDAEVHD
jgi:hypothetical protein